ncbi:MAG: hypothetical protein R3C68_12230 [Myxococcota bacterium]
MMPSRMFVRRLSLAFSLVCSACSPSQQRTPTPAALEQVTVDPWWYNAAFYEIYVRSFADSDGNGVGIFRESSVSWTTWRI